ncbi:MAG: hypothetical protein GY913_29180 [Proteobacteria bacterium]|nr:hypothetical protein [Pseudomonadota bacterium]MCP4920988.1 hypothetical protein [Pseudomonadota bacterium]
MAYEQLIRDLRDSPHDFMDMKAPQYLDATLRGYAQIDSGFRAVMTAVDARVRKERGVRIAASAGVILEATELDLGRGYALLLKAVAQSRGAGAPVDPVRRTLPALLPAMAGARAQIHPHRIGDARPFVQGAMRAFDDAGIDVTEDLERLATYEKWLQGRFHIPGRWDRIIDMLDLGKGKAVPFFVRTFQQQLQQAGALMVPIVGLD